MGLYRHSCGHLVDGADPEDRCNCARQWANLNGRDCPNCEIELQQGDWPWPCEGDGDHTPGKYGYEPFSSYVDIALPGAREWGRDAAGNRAFGVQIDSREQRRAIMKANGLESGGRLQRRNGGRLNKRDPRPLADKIDQAMAGVRWGG